MTTTNNYQELYKQYRPRVFDDVVGQDTAVKQLKNIIVNKKVPTGMAFSAIHGSGKTTLALILTKVLNCANPVDELTPCNKCDICKAIDNNTQIGFKYFSAANSSSVESMREIVKEARLSYPINKPVFIVDEAHRLSNTAWDSLLIPLEAENMKTLFIFCTTEPDKIPPAILSRVTMFNLPPVHWKIITKHLYHIVQKEGLEDKVSKQDIVACAQDSRGSVRKAIQLLETVIQDGKLPTNLTSQLINSILSGNPVEVVKVIRQMNEEGSDFVKIIETVYREFTTALEVSLGDESEATPVSKHIASQIPGNIILKSLDLFGEGITALRNKIISPQVLFQIPVLKVTLLIRKSKSTN